MERQQGTRRRMIGGLGMAILGLAVGRQATSADSKSPKMDKNAFADGCRSGGNSFVDNPDGSFQCNLKDGSDITCTSTSGPCVYNPPPAHIVHPGHLGDIGDLQNITLAVPKELAGYVAPPKKRKKGKKARSRAS